MPPPGPLLRIKDVKLPLLFLITAALPALDVPAVEKALRQEMTSLRVPGAAMIIFEHGKPLLVKGYGVRSADDPIAVNEKTLFRLGSTAKLFTALAALQLAQSGRLDLHAPIGGHPVFGGVTMHQLLTHTAGLRDDAPQDGPHDESALARNVETYGSDDVLAPAGKIFSYANTGYVLAGRVIERISGKPFAAAVHELVLAPNGMHASTYRPFEAILHPLALPHDPAGKLIRPFPDHAGAWPPGSLFSSAEDIAKLFSRALPEPVMKQHATIAGTGQHYGYGTIVEEERVYHTGGRLGYGSRFEIFPAHGVAVFLMGNRTAALFSRTSAALRSQLMKSAATANPAAVELPAEEARRLAGTYVNRGPIRAELALSDGALHLKAGARSIPIQKLGDNLYRAPGGAQMQNFRIVNGTSGQPDYLCAEVWCLKKQ